MVLLGAPAATDGESEESERGDMAPDAALLLAADTIEDLELGD